MSKMQKDIRRSLLLIDLQTVCSHTSYCKKYTPTNILIRKKKKEKRNKEKERMREINEPKDWSASA